ncbi:MAG: hypothetical protein EXR31_09220 [Betaproteobacteria bacterium]|nr:hypothetical protein [Betaproteobacteria bacterium]
MAISIFNPVGRVAKHAMSEAAVRPGALESLDKMRAGLVFNHHPACLELWKHLEEGLLTAHRPASVTRLSKGNISKPQTREELAGVAAETDYALVGVGA